MWTKLLEAAWPYIVKTIAIGLAVVFVYNYGRNNERAVWEPRLAQAALEQAKVETELATKDALAKQITTQSETHYANTISDLVERNASYARSFNDLSLRIARLAAVGSRMSTVPAAAGEPDDSAAIEERAGRAAERFDRAGHNCELDAAQLEGLQGWVITQGLLWSTQPSALP